MSAHPFFSQDPNGLRESVAKQQQIRAVAGQRSSPESGFANKTKMFFRAKNKDRNHWTIKYRSL